MYQVIKRYDEGWSCVYRQHRAEHSHCRFLHGYDLQFEICFACTTLDERNWVVDFGGLKELKSFLQETFDHKCLVAEDDPRIDLFRELSAAGLIDAVFVAAISCEKFAEMVYCRVYEILSKMEVMPRVRLVSVKVSEHSGNTGQYVA